MSGLKSRRKGMGGEYEIRDYFRSLGYTANRVPSSGAAEGFKGDVAVEGNGSSPFLVEVKRRKNAFTSMYRLLANTHSSLAYGFCYKGQCVLMGTHFSDVVPSEGTVYHITSQPCLLLNRVIALKKLLGQAHYLAIRDDSKPWLFLSFR